MIVASTYSCICSWVGNLNALEKRNISCPCCKLNCSFLVVELRTCCTQLQCYCLKIQRFSDKFTVLNFGNVSIFLLTHSVFFRLFGHASKVKFLVLWYQIYWHGALEHSGTMEVLQILSLNLNLIYSVLQLDCNMNLFVPDL
jgi:hypothetical protein